MKDRVSITITDHVADVRLIRGDKMNALDPAMMNGIIEAGEYLKGRADIRAVVLSGEGRAFCAGLDMANFAAMADNAGKGGGAPTSDGEGRLVKRTHGVANLAQYTSLVWRDVPVPVIAAVHGVAFGGGFQIMIGADMRFAARDTRFSIMEIKWGLVPDMGATPLLGTFMRDDVMRELVYTGRIFHADEAFQNGVVTRICDDPHAEAHELAKDIASKNPDAVRASKRMMNKLPFSSMADALLEESREQDKLIGTKNQIEAVMSNIEQRAPKYSDPV